jgi:PST family polysaccharide transporter
MVFALAAPIAALAAGLITGDWLIAPLTAISLASTGLLPSWYCVGVGRPSLIAVYEIVPRLVGSALAALAVVWSSELIYYPILLLMPTLFTLVIFRPGPKAERRVGWREVVEEFADQRHVAFASVFWGSSGTLPVPLVAVVASGSALAIFAVADKMYRAGVFGIQALASSFQGWVAEPPPDQRRRRMVLATSSHFMLGMLGLLGFALAGPAVSGLLFGQELAADRATCALFGIATLALAISSSLGNHWLAPMRKTRALLNSAVGGTLVGLPLVFVLAGSFGATGGAAGIAAGEITVCLVQLAALVWPAVKGRRPPPPIEGRTQ